MEIIEGNQQQQLLNEIQYLYGWLLRDAATLEVRRGQSGGIDRLQNFREPFVRLVTLASFNRNFAEAIKPFYTPYRIKMRRVYISPSNVRQLTRETIHIWDKVSEALGESKLIVLQGE